MRHTPAEWDKFYALVRDGQSVRSACRTVGLHYNTGYKKIKELRSKGVDPTAERKLKPYPANWSQLGSEAKAAFDDPILFRLRYFGHPSEPWEIETMQRIVAALESADREYIVENAPPGVGKTTMLHDAAAWVTVRNRAIRGVFGSKNASNARRMMRRLRRSLERVSPVKAKPEDIKHGMAFDAVASLAGDYGLFRPTSQFDVWNNDEFVVVQADDTPIEEKESTWTAFGIDSDVLSMRYDLMLCDDMDDNKTTKSVDAATGFRIKWDDEIESRLEPRGVIMLVEQRISPLDLSRYNLDKLDPPDPELLDTMTEEQQQIALETAPTMYTHIVYKAHDETKCRGFDTHRHDAPAQPAGCLLSPKRLPWRDIARLRASKPRTFALQYQQQDVNPEQVLVKPVWIAGGTDIDEETRIPFQAPGCLDPDRNLCELPADAGTVYSMATVDPAPSNWWAIQWWAVTKDPHPQVILLDTIKRRMNADDLLSRHPVTGDYMGVMEDWQQRSRRLNIPITHWVFEVNSQNRFVLRDSVHGPWRGHNFVDIVPHTTGVNKASPEFGVYMMRDWFRFGRVRLPYAPGARHATQFLIDELTRYPNPGPSDQVMAAWFLFSNLFHLASPPSTNTLQPRPSWAETLDTRSRLSLVSA